MTNRSMLPMGFNGRTEGCRTQPRLHRPSGRLAGAVVAACCAWPLAAMAGDVFVCAELKAAVADAGRGFAAFKGALKSPANSSTMSERTFLAKSSLTGATSCRVVDTRMEGPTMRLQQTAYRCQFPGISKLDRALRTGLARCVAGEMDDPSDHNDFTLWVERFSSGEGYRGVEVNAQANAANGLTLQVRQSVCTNKGEGPTCED